jgi:hypothetical protein
VLALQACTGGKQEAARAGVGISMVVTTGEASAVIVPILRITSLRERVSFSTGMVSASSNAALFNFPKAIWTICSSMSGFTCAYKCRAMSVMVLSPSHALQTAAAVQFRHCLKCVLSS